MIGMRAHDLEYDDIAVLAEKLAQYDKHTVQLALLKSVAGLKDGAFTPGFAREIKQILDKHNIGISVLGCYINPVCPNQQERRVQINRFKEHIRYAKFLGADMVGTETGSVNPDGSFNEKNHSEENYRDFLSVMRELAEYARDLGVCIGIEAVRIFTIHSPETMKRMLDDLNMPNIFVIFDPVNYLDYENYKQQRKIFQTAFDLYGDRIAVVHLKDFTAENGKLNYALPTEGELDYAFLAHLIYENKPHIPLLLEEVKEKDLVRITEKVQAVFGEWSYLNLP